jgi:hypothetical protein
LPSGRGGTRCGRRRAGPRGGERARPRRLRLALPRRAASAPRSRSSAERSSVRPELGEGPRGTRTGPFPTSGSPSRRERGKDAPVTRRSRRRPANGEGMETPRGTGCLMHSPGLLCPWNTPWGGRLTRGLASTGEARTGPGCTPERKRRQRGRPRPRRPQRLEGRAGDATRRRAGGSARRQSRPTSTADRCCQRLA